MFGNILNYILGLGAAIFLPIIMIIIGLIIKMKFKRAVISGLTLGVALTGMNVVLGFMFDTISPVASAFVEKTGIQLNIIDEIPKSITEKKYYEIEEKMKEYSEYSEITMGELDLVLWYKEAGEVFK